ncbi:unnamed protein product, partial [Linum tenue]
SFLQSLFIAFFIAACLSSLSLRHFHHLSQEIRTVLQCERRSRIPQPRSTTMGASSNGGYCASNYASYCQNRRFSKEVLDNVHGTIYLDPLALKFVDTEQFQRQASGSQAAR